MAVRVDGTSSRFEGSSLGILDSATFTASIWFFHEETGVSKPVLNFRNLASAVSSGVSIGNSFVDLTGRNSGGTLVLSTRSDNNPTSVLPNIWNHALIAVDLRTGAATPTAIRINGVLQVLTDTTVTAGQTVHFNTDEVLVAAAKGVGDTVSAPWIGRLDEIYFTTDYLDISNPTISTRFYGLLGEQIGLGSAATTPTRNAGTRPEIFLTHGPTNFGRNEGTAGDLARVGLPTFASGPAPAVETLSRGFWGERWRESERSGIPFRESRLVLEPATGLEVARREFSTDRDQINKRRRRGSTIFEF